MVGELDALICRRPCPWHLCCAGGAPSVEMFSRFTDHAARGNTFLRSPRRGVLHKPQTIPLICSTPQIEKCINQLLIASSWLFRNGVGLESRNILDTDELVTRMAVGMSIQVCIKVVTRSNPFLLTNFLTK